MEVKSIAGDNHLGGEDFNSKLVSYFEKETCLDITTLDKKELWQNVAYTNYFYLKDTKRYYFIDDITVNHGYIEIKGHTDVLSSFWNYIKIKQCYINRQENAYSKYIVDNEYPVYSTRDIDVINIPCDFLTGNSYILTVTGGI